MPFRGHVIKINRVAFDLSFIFLTSLPPRMPPQRNSRPSTRQQPSARHLFSAVVEKAHIDVSSLDDQQRAVFDKALAGKNIFVTGGGGQCHVASAPFGSEVIVGCGKSFLLRAITDALKQKTGYAFMVAVTASTGMASSRIGGMSSFPLHPRNEVDLQLGHTIHSWAGLTGSEKSLADALKRIKTNPQIPLRWLETKVLICDEGMSSFRISRVYTHRRFSVSMLGADYFDLLEAVARDIRGNDLPFGGIQVG